MSTQRIATSRRNALALALWACGCGATAAHGEAGRISTEQASPGRASAPWLDVRTLDGADGYYAERGLPLPDTEAECGNALATTRATGPLCRVRFALRGAPQAFEPFEARLLASTDAADARRRVAELPERYGLPDGREIAYRALFAPVLDATAQGVSSLSRLEVGQVGRLLDADVQQRLAARILERRYATAISPVSVVVVASSPFPGIFASDGAHRGALARIDRELCAFAETILHESVHWLAHEDPNGGAIGALRTRLARAGATPEQLEIAENAFVFLAGADLSRRLPGCEAFTGTAGTAAFFEQAGPTARAVRDAFVPYVAGSTTFETALDEAARTFAAPPR